MSELQISLLVIGIVIVLVLYGFSWRQQRQYLHKFGATFKPQHEDVLYQQPQEDSASGTSKTSLPENLPTELLVVKNPEPAGSQPTGSQPVGSASPAITSDHSNSHAHAADEICGLLDASTDYIVLVTPVRPTGSDALAHLWQQRFDFGQNVTVCGLNAANGIWEKVLAESRAAYSAFKLALQLVSRSGAISETRLEDFREIARLIATQLQADASLPDVAPAAMRAQQLDKFCAAVDQVIGLNIFLSGARSLHGREVAHAAEQHGFGLQADGTFHLLDEHAHTVFTLGNANHVPFQHHTMESLRIEGLTLLLDLPCVPQPVQHFDQMAMLARQLASDLHAVVADDRHVALSEAGCTLIREQIIAVEAAMLAKNIIPGSAQARRLFS